MPLSLETLYDFGSFQEITPYLEEMDKLISKLSPIWKPLRALPKSDPLMDETVTTLSKKEYRNKSFWEDRTKAQQLITALQALLFWNEVLPETKYIPEIQVFLKAAIQHPKEFAKLKRESWFQKLVESGHASKLINTLSKPGFIDAFEQLKKEFGFPKDKIQTLTELLALAPSLGIEAIKGNPSHAEQMSQFLMVKPNENHRVERLRKHLALNPTSFESIVTRAMETIHYWLRQFHEHSPKDGFLSESAKRLWGSYTGALSDIHYALSLNWETSKNSFLGTGFASVKYENLNPTAKEYWICLLANIEKLQESLLEYSLIQDALQAFNKKTTASIQRFFEKWIAENYPKDPLLNFNHPLEALPRPRHLDQKIIQEIGRLTDVFIYNPIPIEFKEKHPNSSAVMVRSFGKHIECPISTLPGAVEYQWYVHEKIHFITAIAAFQKRDLQSWSFPLKEMARRVGENKKPLLLEYATEALSRYICVRDPAFLNLLPEALQKQPPEIIEKELDTSMFGYSALLKVARKLNAALELEDMDLIKALIFKDARRNLESKLHKIGLTLEQYVARLEEGYSKIPH